MSKSALLTIFLVLAFGTSAFAQMTYKPGKEWEKADANVPEFKTDRSEYEHALAVYQAGNTDEAIHLCDIVVKTYGKGPWVEQAMLLKARAYFKQGKIKQADRQLTLLKEKFPGTTLTREISDLQIAIGSAYVDKRKYEGVRILENMVETNPYGPRADEAQFKTAQYYLDKRQYRDAAEAFALVAAQYPDSRCREEAMFLRAKAYYLNNEGPRRDPLPYEESRDAVNAYLKDYPNGSFTQPAQELLAKIEDALSHKQYLIGEYYRGQGQQRAADKYYRYLVKRYPNSTWAKKAIKRLGKEPEALTPEPEPVKTDTAPKPARTTGDTDETGGGKP